MEVFMAKPKITPSPTDRFFLKKNFLGKRDSHVRRLGANKDQVPLPDKGMGRGGTTFTIVRKIRRPSCASRSKRCLGVARLSCGAESQRDRQNISQRAGWARYWDQAPAGLTFHQQVQRYWMARTSVSQFGGAPFAQIPPHWEERGKMARATTSAFTPSISLNAALSDRSHKHVVNLSRAFHRAAPLVSVVCRISRSGKRMSVRWRQLLWGLTINLAMT